MIRCFEPRDLVRLACYQKMLDFCAVPRTQSEIDSIFIGKNVTTVRRFLLDLVEHESGAYIEQNGRKTCTETKRSSRTFLTLKPIFNELDLEPVARGKPVVAVEKKPAVLPPCARIISFSDKHLKKELHKQDELIRAEHRAIIRNNYASGGSLSSVFM